MFVRLTILPQPGDIEWERSNSPGANLPIDRLVNADLIASIDWHPDYAQTPDSPGSIVTFKDCSQRTVEEPLDVLAEMLCHAGASLFNRSI